ncbi:MAG: dephospho-CoA kinase [Lachnospiraceae bacterium]
MRIIGITGGVGAGKSTVLKLLEDMTRCIVIRTDEVAKETTMLQGAAYKPIVELLGRDILAPDLTIDRKKMAERIFSDEELCAKVNGIIHPLTMDAVKQRICEAQAEEQYDFAFIEAALLIEAGYQTVCEEFWYVYVPKEERIRRLMADRGYTRDKCLAIMDNQLSDEEFRKNCRRIIDNSADSLDTKKQLEALIKDYSVEEG